MGKKLAVILALILILGGCRAQPTIQTQPLAEEPTAPPFAPVTVVDNEFCSFQLQDIDPQAPLVIRWKCCWRIKQSWS